MADVVRYKLFLNNNKTIVEIFQTEVGKTQRYMYIPADLTSKADAQTICDIITNGGNIAKSCVYDIINGGNTYYFTWKVKESMVRKESKVFEDVQDFLRRSTKATPTITASNTSLTPKFKFEIGDTFRTYSGTIYTIKDIIAPLEDYVLAYDDYESNINNKDFERKVESGVYKQIFVNQPAQNVTAITNKQFNDAILNELKQVKGGDIIKIIRKKDGSIYKQLEVIDFKGNNTNWGIDAKIDLGGGAGTTALHYKDYWEEILKEDDYEIQIIKKVQPLKVGDKVKIAKSSFYYVDGDEANPKDTIGTITAFDKSGILVTWENSKYNSYDEKDLELVPQAQAFKVGDKVQIKKGSRYYGKDEKNPKDTIGEIIEIEDVFPKVKWGNETTNIYEFKDLELAQQVQQDLRLAVNMSAPHQISEVKGLDSTGSYWQLRELGDTIIDTKKRYEFFVEGDVLEAISNTTPTNKIKFKVVEINHADQTISYQKFQEDIQDFDTKFPGKITIESLFQTPIELIQPIQLEETQIQVKPIVYAVDTEWQDIMEVVSLGQKMTSPKDDYWVLYHKKDDESYTQNRRNFFVDGDIVKFTRVKDKTLFYGRINKIDLILGRISWLNVDDNLSGEFYLNGLFDDYSLEIMEFYNLRELFEKPILVPKQDSGATPIIPPSTILGEIEQAKKDLGQLLFMRNLLSPIDFEQKIEITQLIDQKQKLINELNFRGIEEKMATDKFFDDLFEQSFVEIKHEYQDIYNNDQELDFFTPNGKKSELSFELNEIIRTPQFKEWFGDWELAYIYKDADALELDCSKVLTPDFEPRVVWHGTGQQFSYFIFDKFPAAYFAVNKEYSQFFADLQGGGDGYVIPFFLNIRNPLDLTHFETKLINSKEFFDYLYLMTGLTMEQLDVNPIFLSGATPALETWMYIRNNPKMLKKIADTHIYDGIHFYETNPNIPDVTSKAHKTEAYITFSADQCKIAEPNRGMLLFASLKSFLLKRGGKI
jgi:hypothetical protein